MATAKKHTRGIYKSYFFKEHDPVLDALDRVYQLTGMVNANGTPRAQKLAELSGVSTSTIYSYHVRKTKRPRSDCVEALLRAVGASRAIVYRGKLIRYGASTRFRTTELSLVQATRTASDG